MTDFREILADTKKLARAINSIELSKKQIAHLASLCTMKNGVPVERDANGRPQGRYVRTCSYIGTKLTKHFAGIGPRDKMMWIGYITKSGKWKATPEIKAALLHLGWLME